MSSSYLSRQMSFHSSAYVLGLPIFLNNMVGAQWPSGRVLDLRPECLTQDWVVAGLSLTGITAL